MTPYQNPNISADSNISLITSDWSETGRGSHVDFRDDETIPLVQGKFLGRGAAGEVYETTIKGQKIACKRMAFRRKICEADRKEIEILKKLSHTHIIQLIGTYTHHQFLGILLFPVAVCDLRTFFEDVEAHYQGLGLDNQQRTRLTALDYFSSCRKCYMASPIYSSIGCLISAIAYLHGQRIRHKDLKPSNILLSPGRLYLSDFGSATDFSFLSHSATDNERGTERYFAPEVAAWEPNGRAADIFSLGCLMLEIVVLHTDGTLDALKRLRTSRDRSFFQANLDTIDVWLAQWIVLDTNTSPRRSHLMWEIRGMLARDPKRRPTAPELLQRVESCDSWRKSATSIFGDCCRTSYISVQEHETVKHSLGQEVERLRHELETVMHTLKESKPQENDSQKTPRQMEQKTKVEDVDARLKSSKAKKRSKAKERTTAKAVREAKDMERMIIEKKDLDRRRREEEERFHVEEEQRKAEIQKVRHAARLKEENNRLSQDKIEAEAAEQKRLEDAEMERMIAEMEEAELQREEQEKNYAEGKRRKAEEEKVRYAAGLKERDTRLRQQEREAEEAEDARKQMIADASPAHHAVNKALFAILKNDTR